MKRWTRFPDEVERTKKVYEEISVVLATSVGNDRADEETTMEEFCELIKALTGIDLHGAFDPDVAMIGRMAARQWLRAVGYVTM